MVTSGPTSPKVRIFFTSALKKRTMGYRRVTLGMRTTKSKSRARTPRRKARVAFAPRPMQSAVQLIKRVVKSQAETKYRTFYSGGVLGPLLDPGDYSIRAYTLQNQFITSNVTDIHRLIPTVLQGVGDNQRIGVKISPTSLVLTGNFTVNLQQIWQNNIPRDIVVVMYVLQHVTLKDYTSLVAGNDFNQLLDTGEQGTARFNGDIQSAQLPVNRQVYRLLAKKVIPLRYAGVQPAGVTFTAPVSVANAHNYQASYKLNLTKHLPKVLTYNENTTSGLGLGDPTNSSIFMTCAWYEMNGGIPPTTASVVFQQEYVSHFHYKDL